MGVVFYNYMLMGVVFPLNAKWTTVMSVGEYSFYFQPGIWRVGILLEASYLPQLKDDPMKLIHPILEVSSESKSDCGAVALCKQGHLNTYQYVNEYVTPSPSGCTLHAVDHSNCRFPAILAAPLSDECIDFDEVFNEIGITLSKLQISTGLPHESEPTILLSSQHFLETFGFVTRESIWFRWYNPTILEQVLLAPLDGLTHQQIISQAGDVVAQIYQKSEKESIIMHQDFKFTFTASLSSDSGNYEDSLLTFQVMECVPVLQGKITKNTVITILPLSNISLPSSQHKLARDEGRDLCSAASASEFHGVGKEAALSDSFVIEAVGVSPYKLQNQYIVLPKETATKHGIFHCQNVLVEPAKLTGIKVPSNLTDLTVPLSTSKQDKRETVHMAIAFLYEDEYELERYVPPSGLGVDCDTAALTVAYVHPELLFFLFPETLSPSRHYYLNIKKAKAKNALPAVKILEIAEVSNPEVQVQESAMAERLSLRHPIYDFFNQRSVFLSVGEVFKVTTNTGCVRRYMVCSLEPNTNGAAAIEANIKSECIMKDAKEHSYIPDIVPPSILSEPNLFLSIHPPGLEHHANSLFKFFLPAFKAVSSTQPRRCPSVLVTGPPGVGKRTIVRAVARRCRMHIMEFNCHEFTSDNLAFTEKKFRNDMSNANLYTPVVIILSNIHIIGRKNMSQEEPRVSSLFESYMTQVNEFNRSSDFPALVVGLTSRSEEIPGRVQSCFLHHLQVSAPTQGQRSAMLKSLSKSYHLSSNVDFTSLAQSTAGHVLRDFVALFSQAFDLAVRETLNHCSEAGPCNIEDIAISGVVLKRNHLEDALDILHSQHSDSIGAPKIPSVNWEDVGGLAEAKKEILDTIQLPLHYPDLFGSGLRRSGVLLYGAPGTGKTLLAKAVATECSLNFLSVKGPELINMYVGQSEENIREVFGRARRCAPCVIFFDELDSIAPNRGHSGDSGGVMDRVVSQLLAELDGLHSTKDVFMIGATNRPDLLDPALLRPGRFDRLVYLGVNEDAESKEKILKAITRKFNLSPDVDLGALAMKCPAILTGADLYALSSDAMLSALRRQIDQLEAGNAVDEEWRGKLVVEQGDFLLALDSLRPSITPEELSKYKNIKARISS